MPLAGGIAVALGRIGDAGAAQRGKNSSAIAGNGFQQPMNAIGILSKGNSHATCSLCLRICALSRFRRLGSGTAGADCDSYRHSDFDTQRPLLGSDLDEQRCNRMHRDWL
jgi:hypothetical protein